MRSHRVAVWTAAVACSALAVLPGTAGRTAEDPGPDLTILSTQDVQGEITPCG